MQWVHVVLTLACLGSGAFHLARLALMRGDRVGEASHAAMGFGMAAMFSPLGDPVPAGVWITVFCVTGVWFAGLALRSGFETRDAGFHVVAGATMLFMLLAGATEHSAPGGMGHLGGGLAVASVAVVALGGFFVWHALRCGDRIAAAGRAGEGCGGVIVAEAPARDDRFRRLRAPRTAAAVHLGMAGAMTVMLLGML